MLYRAGPKDLLAVFFYTLIMILSHAVIQEFILDVGDMNNSAVISSCMIVCTA